MSSGATHPSNGDDSTPPRIDDRLVQWMALQMVQDARARLVEGGAGADARIELASVFVDLAVTVHGERGVLDDARIIEYLCAQPDTDDTEAAPAPSLAMVSPSEPRSRWLLVGGPGSGKSTATTMIAQLLRRPWIEHQRNALPEVLNARVEPIAGKLGVLAARLEVRPRHGVLPLRVNLPSLARWMASQTSGDSSSLLWRYLAARMNDDAVAQELTLTIDEHDVEAVIRAVPSVFWIFDGLDEVPQAAGRDETVSVIRAALCSNEHHAPGLLVTTRPQGYEGELDDLATLVLEPMPVELAREYGERLLKAWIGDEADFAVRRETLQAELERPEIQALVQTPLHTTMAALLVAMQGSLPRSRWLLFEHYFTTIFKRELGKPSGHSFRAEDEPTIRDLHARAGLVLHVRAQEQAGARPALSRRELREELSGIFREKGHAEEDVTEITERMMRFATERLVLLMHARSDEYSFGVRSLQEFFAADALLRGERTHVRKRLEAIALDPHWSNVLALLVSKCALADSGQARPHLLEYTAGLCRALNDGTVGGAAARHCLMGTRLALGMLKETERYGEPWLHEPLWQIALEAATSPVQLEIQRRSRQATPQMHDRGSTPSFWNDYLEIHMNLGLVAAQWEGFGKKTHHTAILDAARDLLLGSKERRLAGWLLLYGPLLVNEPDAIRLADQHAPADRAEAHEVMSALFNQWAIFEMPDWFAQFIQTHSGWFTPTWPSWSNIDNESLPAAPPFSAAGLFASVRPRALRLIVLDDRLGMRLGSIEQSISAWNAILSALPDEGAEWDLWKRVASFHVAPSHTALADVLEAATAPSAFKELQRSRWRFAWPITACSEFVDDPGQLRSLAEEARGGHLGTIDDWRAAEARWRRSPRIAPEELNEWLAEGPLPWDRSIANGGIVVSGISSPDPQGDPGTPTSIDQHAQLIRHVTAAAQHSVRAGVLLGKLLLDGALFHRPPLLDTIPSQLVRSAEQVRPRETGHALSFVDRVLPDLTGPGAGEWFDLLDERGRQVKNRWSGRMANTLLQGRRCADNIKALMSRLTERPDQWGLASALLVMLRIAPNVDLAAFPSLQLPEDAPAGARATAAFLRLLSGAYDTAQFTPLVRLLLATGDGDERGLQKLMADILVQRSRDPDRLLDILITALAEAPSDSPHRDALLGALFARLRRSARPAFLSAEEWSDLALPGPFLSGQGPERPPPRLVRLVELTNLRLFKETPSVDVPFPVPPADTGQWIILTGENGIGKTTLLRGLALALASPEVASKLLDERLPMVRNGGEGRITIELDGGILDAVVRFKERTETVNRGPSEPESARRPWVVGYGVRRGNARGEQDREPEWGPIGELHTLFDRPASLVNATDWLIKLERQVLREERQQPRDAPGSPVGSRAAVWQSVVRALETLLEVTAIEPEDEHVFVQHPQFGRVRLDALSDGYLTTTGWVIDLLARWVDRQRALDEPVGPDMLRRMTGFVLIDEIDLHLHPVWQMRVLDDVRRLFPRLSFVVTTHNPLTLQGARSGEVYVMRRDGSRVELVQRDIRPGHDVDRVLFEQFGIEHTFDKDTRDLLRKHREMLERGARLDDPDRIALEAKLAERLGGVGEIVRAERRGAADPLPSLTPDERHLLTPFLKKRP